MGSLTRTAFDRALQDENRRAREEGGPLIVVDDSASALIYACLQRGMIWHLLAYGPLIMTFSSVYICLVEIIDCFLLLVRRYTTDNDCPTLCGCLELY